MFGYWWRGFSQFARTIQGAVILALAAVVLTYVVGWHTFHTLAVLPFAVLLLCPLMHVFMHGGHHSHVGHNGHVSASETARDTESE